MKTLFAVILALIVGCQTTSEETAVKPELKSSVSILVVMTGVDYVTDAAGKRHKTGYWLEEFSTPFKVFEDAGIKVDIATPTGNSPIVDALSVAVGKDGKPLFWASLKELNEGKKIKSRVIDNGDIIALKDLTNEKLEKYDAVFFPGGHAPMEDLSKDRNVARALKYFHDKKKTTALVCHGPIALMSTAVHGNFLYRGYKITAFSNTEEAQTPTGKHLVTTPENEFKKAGVEFVKGADWTSFVVKDRELITGQNPASSKAIAKAVVSALGVMSIEEKK